MPRPLKTGPDLCGLAGNVSGFLTGRSYIPKVSRNGGGAASMTGRELRRGAAAGPSAGVPAAARRLA
jgi:hypothetical protein